MSKTTTATSKPEAFRRSVTKNPPDQGWRAELHEENDRGWALTAIRMPYYGETLEFVQVDHPDGESSYMRLDADTDEFVAGPFGGGYSWTLPKYVVENAQRLAREAFARAPEGVPA